MVCLPSKAVFQPIGRSAWAGPGCGIKSGAISIVAQARNVLYVNLPPTRRVSVGDLDFMGGCGLVGLVTTVTHSDQ